MYHSKKARTVALLLSFALTASILAGCGSHEAKPGEGSGYTAYGMAECVVEDAGISYPIYLLVKTDEKGVILSVEDDGTEVPEGKDAKYLKAQVLFETLVGKNASSLGELDAVSGATYSSQAIFSAVQQALDEVNIALQSADGSEQES